MLKRLGVPKERVINVIMEPDNWLTKARRGSRLLSQGLGELLARAELIAITEDRGVS